MTKRTSGFGGFLIFIGAYFSGASTMRALHLIPSGLAQQAALGKFFIAGMIFMAFGCWWSYKVFTSPEPLRLAKEEPNTLGNWMRSQSASNVPPLPRSKYEIPPVTVESSHWSRRYLVATAVAMLLGLAVAYFPPLFALLVVVWVFWQHAHNLGLGWNPVDRSYMTMYILRALIAFAIFFGINALPWVLMISSHPDEGTMTVVGWAGILWMPVVMLIAAFIASKVFRVWTITRD